MSETDHEYFKKTAIESGEKIEQSSIFLSLLSHSYKEDPITALQLGIAILLNKPIAVVTLQNEPVPPALQRLAFAIENANSPQDMKGAVEKVLKKADELKI